MTSSTVNSTTTQEPTVFVASEAQLLRAAKLRRFNRLAVYLPIGLTAVLLLGSLFFLVWRAVVPVKTAVFSTATLSGIADLLLIITLLPLIMLLPLITAAAIYGLIYWRQSSQQRPAHERDRLRLLLWKLGNLLDTAQTKITAVADQATKPLIQGNARLNQAITIVNQLRKPKNTP